MTKKEVAQAYINELEQGHVANVVALFSANGIVESPLYGLQNASDFYVQLNNDTHNSKLSLKGIFEDHNTGHMALYFEYIWTLRSDEKVTFDVVDILEFDTNNKITKLKIIYDTVISRRLLESLEAE